MSPGPTEAGPPPTEPRCPRCGYSLAGLPPDSACPECGRDRPPEVVEDRPCLRCGYSLSGLARDGVCPECGTPIAFSLRGNLLVYSAPEYVASLHRGVVVVECGIALWVLMRIGAIFGVVALAASGAGGPRQAYLILWQAASLAVSAMSLSGWWMLSTPDPAYVGTDNGSMARRILRVVIAVSAAAFLVSSGLQLAFGAAAGTYQTSPSSGGPPVVSLAQLAMGLAELASGLAWIVQFFVAMQYLRWLAPRLPDAGVAKKARLYMWLLPVIYVVGFICIGLGPLIAFILYVALLDALRKRAPRDPCADRERVMPLTRRR